MSDVSAGDRVTWEYGTLGSGTASGEVLETGLQKFGYDDVMKVANDNGQVNHVRPKDLV